MPLHSPGAAMTNSVNWFLLRLICFGMVSLSYGTLNGKFVLIRGHTVAGFSCLNKCNFLIIYSAYSQTTSKEHRQGEVEYFLQIIQPAVCKYFCGIWVTNSVLLYIQWNHHWTNMSQLIWKRVTVFFHSCRRFFQLHIFTGIVFHHYTSNLLIISHWTQGQCYLKWNMMFSLGICNWYEQIPSLFYTEVSVSFENYCYDRWSLKTGTSHRFR